MKHARLATMLLALSLLTSAATAYAECAWVLWITSTPPPGLISLTPVILSSYGSMADCVREINNYDKGIPHSPVGRFSPTRLVIPYEANQQGGTRELL
jgi:hypothetical protein